MENAADALLMGFSVLAFGLALSISLFAFNNVSVASETIINMRDRETSYTYVDYTSEDTSRIVSVEDIVPSLYRAYKEQYLVRFEGLGDIYEIRDSETNEYVGTNIIDLESQSIGNQQDASNFIKALLGGGTAFKELTSQQRFANFGNYLQTFSLYDILKENTFVETLGIFYQEDRTEDGQATADEGVDDVNKTQKRIITYTLQ